MQDTISKSHIEAFVKGVQSKKITSSEVCNEIERWIHDLPDDRVLEEDPFGPPTVQDLDDCQLLPILGGIASMGKLHPEIATVLIPELINNPRSRRQLATVLGDIAQHHEHIVDELQSLLEHPAPDVRRAAVRAFVIAGVASEKAAFALIDLLMHAEGEDGEIEEIVEAVAETGRDSQNVYGDLVLAWEMSADSMEQTHLTAAMHGIVDRSNSAVAWLSQLLKSYHDANVRELAATALAHRSSTAAVEKELRVGMQDSHRGVRAASCLALLKAATPKAEHLVSGFKDALEDEYDEVRCLALRGLGQIGRAAEAAIQDVVAALLNKDEGMFNRMEAALALIAIDRPTACQHIAPVLCECIEKGTSVERSQASRVVRELCMTEVPETDMQN